MLLIENELLQKLKNTGSDIIVEKKNLAEKQ